MWSWLKRRHQTWREWRRLRKDFGLRRRTWESRTEQTPPYAGCYNSPKGWREGRIRGHAITFWPVLRRSKYSGEMMVGAFNFYWNYNAYWRNAPQSNDIFEIIGGWWKKCVLKKVEFPPEFHIEGPKGHPEARLPSVMNMIELMREHPEVDHLGVCFKGVHIRFKKAAIPVVREAAELGAGIVDELLKRETPPLLLAVEAGDIILAGKLLDEGADPEEYGPDLFNFFPDGNGENRKTPLLTAVFQDDPALIELLISRGANMETSASFIARVALENERNKALAALYKGGFGTPPWGLGQPHGMPLQFAASKGNVEAVRILLEAGEDPAKKGEGEPKPARKLASGPHKEEIIRLLNEAVQERQAAQGQLSITETADDGQLSLSPKEP